MTIRPEAWRTALSTTLLVAGLFLHGAGAQADGPTGADAEEALSAGSATSIDPPDRNAYQHVTANLPQDEEMRFQIGRAMFRKLWVAAPSSTQASDGLGPLYNARSCESCHRRDGRGRPPQAGETGTGFLLRLARNPVTPEEHEAVSTHRVLNFPDAVYGVQLQDLAIPGLASEGDIGLRYTERPVTLADGTIVRLRKPAYSIDNPRYGFPDPGTTISPRLAPPMIGLGLIEAIPEEAILAQVDPDDRDGDGVSGRAAYAIASEGTPARLGRFGWKGQHATVREQTAAALAHDIGISSPALDLPYGDCTRRQKACLARPSGVQLRLGPTEISAEAFDALVFYAENLAVPARRKASFPEVLAGKVQFAAMGCPACHTPRFTTGRDATIPALGGQTIRPYSDFLLHDMGPELADSQVVGMASGSEWRTPPLWGLGLSSTVNGNGFYMHDGRARTLEEAILWHGGEAERTRDAYRNASVRDRQSLIRFLESL